MLDNSSYAKDFTLTSNPLSQGERKLKRGLRPCAPYTNLRNMN